jgi:S-layer glycoprotein
LTPRGSAWRLSARLAVVLLAAFALLAAVPPAAALSDVAQGDSISITGFAPGARQVGIWIFGPNRFTYGTATVQSDGSYAYRIDGATTASFSPSEYVAVIQHPGPLGVFDVTPTADRTAMNLVVPFPGTKVILAGLAAPQAAHALEAALDSPDIDDTWTSTSFVVTAPRVSIDTPRQASVGSPLTITGTTNLAPGDNLLVSVTSSAFTPTTKGEAGGFSGTSGSVTVQPGTGGANSWSFLVDTTSFAPGEYTVLVSGVGVDVSDTASFTLVPVTRTPVPVSTPPTSTTVQPAGTTPLPTAIATPGTTTPAGAPMPGFGVPAALAGFAGCSILIRFRGRD